MSERQRPSNYFRTIAGSLFPHLHQHTHTPSSETAALLLTTHLHPHTTPNHSSPCSPPSNNSAGRPLSTSAAHVQNHPPSIGRAITAAATLTADTTPASTDPLLPPPTSGRALTSTAALIGHPEHYLSEATMATGRTSLLTRATQVISNGLELGDGTSYAHRNAPPPPSGWCDQNHRSYLVRLWDAVEEKAAASKYAWTITQRVVSTEKSMIHTFPELGEGDRALSRDWIEYILGLSLRHPFCTAEKMGRWEILAASSGARGTWGPW